MFFYEKVFSLDGDHLFVGFDFNSIIYYSLDKGGHRFVFDGQLILTGSNGDVLEKRYFYFDFIFPLSNSWGNYEIYTPEFFINFGFKKFETPIRCLLDKNSTELLNPFLNVIKQAKQYVAKTTSFLSGNNEKFLSSSFEIIKNNSFGDCDFSNHFPKRNYSVECSFVLEKNVCFKTVYDFESEVFEDSSINFKLNDGDKAIYFRNSISLSFDDLPQIIKFQSLFVDTK